MNRRIDQEERKQLFRRMQWAFVWAPPILAILVASLCAALVAALIRVPGTTYLQRWGAVTVLVLLLSVLLWGLQQLWSRWRAR